MADNTYRSYRSHDPAARKQANPASQGGDPLAELARLIGQGDPYSEGGPNEAYNSGQSDSTAVAAVDWAAEESYAAPDSRADEPYVPPPPTAPYAPQERGYENEASTGGRYFAGPAATFNGFREEPGAYDHDDPPALPPARQLPGYATAPDHGYEADEQEHHGDEAYGAEDYYDEAPSPRRRSGLVLVMAVFGLAVLGTAGAFGYRAMFGGAVLPTLPPIIKASNGPNKIVPSAGDSHANNSSQAGVASTGSTENLVSREEQPVNMDPPKAAPRVVSTIPIITGQGSVSPGVAPPVAPGPVAAAPATNWPPPPSLGGAPPVSVAPPMPTTAPPAQVSSEPKKIHTVTIRADQSGGAEAASTVPAPAARTSTHAASTSPRTNAVASAPPAGGNAPLSIVPGGQAEAPAPSPARMRVAARTASLPTAVASVGPVNGVTAPAASGGGYAVQVTSQRSEAEAHAAFRTLRAKFPNQLSGREPIIRRADLGAKGTYYRALVGPFASAEEAAGLCSGLKSAGGSCIVQRN